MQRIHRGGFTLTELLMVIAIIGILATLSLSVLRGVEEDALISRTNAQIQRISKVLDPKLEESFYRILPARLDPNDDIGYADPSNIQVFRIRAIAEILTVEFPSELDHVNSALYPRNGVGPPLAYDWANEFPTPQMLLRYEAFFGAGAPSTANEQAECLYAILSLNYTENGTAMIEILRKSEIKDTDGDGFNEVVDAFGDPLGFVLWDAVNNAIIDPTNPVEPQNYRFIITSSNVAGKLGQ